MKGLQELESYMKSLEKTEEKTKEVNLEEVYNKVSEIMETLGNLMASIAGLETEPKGEDEDIEVKEEKEEVIENVENDTNL